MIPVVIGALGIMKRTIYKWLENLEWDLTVEVLQRPYFLGMARIIRKVLNVEQRSKKELISRNRRAMDVDRYCGK